MNEHYLLSQPVSLFTVFIRAPPYLSDWLIFLALHAAFRKELTRLHLEDPFSDDRRRQGPKTHDVILLTP